MGKWKKCKICQIIMTQRWYHFNTTILSLFSSGNYKYYTKYLLVLSLHAYKITFLHVTQHHFIFKLLSNGFFSISHIVYIVYCSHGIAHVEHHTILLLICGCCFHGDFSNDRLFVYLIINIFSTLNADIFTGITFDVILCWLEFLLNGNVHPLDPFSHPEPIMPGYTTTMLKSNDRVWLEDH